MSTLSLAEEMALKAKAVRDAIDNDAEAIRRVIRKEAEAAAVEWVDSLIPAISEAADKGKTSLWCDVVARRRAGLNLREKMFALKVKALLEDLGFDADLDFLYPAFQNPLHGVTLTVSWETP